MTGLENIPMAVDAGSRVFASHSLQAEVCIIVLNWRSADDTCECITSIKQTLPQPYGLVVVDNDSGDDSIEKIAGCLDRVYGGHQRILPGQVPLLAPVAHTADVTPPFLICNTDNAGYAGGNNLGLKAAYLSGYQYFWILNNDSVLKTDGLLAMQDTLGDHSVGFVGSIVAKSDDSLECYGGGVFYPYCGRARLMGSKAEFLAAQKNRFLMGSSLMTSRNVIDDIGLMNEGYFMYWEEVDWQMRALEAGYSLVVEEASVIVHKSSERKRGFAFYYYRCRSGVLFTRRFYGWPASLTAGFFILCSEVIQNATNWSAIKWICQGTYRGMVDRLDDDVRIGKKGS